MNAEEVRELVAQVMEIYRKDPAPTYDSDEEWAEYLSQYTGISEQESFTTLYDTLYKIKTANNVLSPVYKLHGLRVHDGHIHNRR